MQRGDTACVVALPHASERPLSYAAERHDVRHVLPHVVVTAGSPRYNMRRRISACTIALSHAAKNTAACIVALPHTSGVTACVDVHSRASIIQNVVLSLASDFPSL